MVRLRKRDYEIIIMQVAILLIIITLIGFLTSLRKTGVGAGLATAIVYDVDSGEEHEIKKQVIYESDEEIFWVVEDNYDYLFYKNKIMGNGWLFDISNPSDAKQCFLINPYVVSKYCCLGYKSACNLVPCR